MVNGDVSKRLIYILNQEWLEEFRVMWRTNPFNRQIALHCPVSIWVDIIDYC